MRFQARDELRKTIKQLERNLTDSLDRITRKPNLPDMVDGDIETKLDTKSIFEEYTRKLFEHANITDEIEWNELTSSEFVTSIQTTIGNKKNCWYIFTMSINQITQMEYHSIMSYLYFYPRLWKYRSSDF